MMSRAPPPPTQSTDRIMTHTNGVLSQNNPQTVKWGERGIVRTVDREVAQRAQRGSHRLHITAIHIGRQAIDDRSNPAQLANLNVVAVCNTKGCQSDTETTQGERMESDGEQAGRRPKQSNERSA